MNNILRDNLTSGSSYLTQYSDDPEVDGAVLDDNIEAVSIALFGDEYSDDDQEYVIGLVSSGVINAYDEDMDIYEAVAAAHASAKAAGGEGWL